MSIIDLQEVAPDMWQAKYRGNYGVYKIKLKMKGGRTESFSCSCPSDYYPCKHIAMIREAVKEHVAVDKKRPKETSLEDLLQDISLKDLQTFVSMQAQYNKEFKKALFLAFSGNKEMKKSVNYNQIIRDALFDVFFDEDELYYSYHDSYVGIDVIDEWLDKAQEYINGENASEAVLICKACIEEFASWLEDQDDYLLESYIDPEYHERMFDLLEQAAFMQGVDRGKLLRYCKTEMEKPQYKQADMYDNFNDLLMKLTDTDGADDFIALQDKLLAAVSDKSSSDAKKILTRKITFYHSNDEPEKAWQIIQENLQIETFRKELVRKMIGENRLNEAKKLINEYITANKGGYLSSWYELKLEVAQIEKDVSTIRSVSFYKIQDRFEGKYYELYKSTFGKKEWAEELEKLLKHYERKGSGSWTDIWANDSDSVADTLLAEKEEKRLMEYVEKNLSADRLKRYYQGFVSSYPAETLRMFEKAANKSAEIQVVVCMSLSNRCLCAY